MLRGSRHRGKVPDRLNIVHCGAGRVMKSYEQMTGKDSEKQGCCNRRIDLTGGV